MTTITSRLLKVRSQIDDAARAAGRDPAEVRLLPVSKYHGVAAIREAHAAGYRIFGESKIQELVSKYGELAADGIEFAVTGHVQTNKAKQVAEFAAEVQSLDSLRLGEALQRRLEGRQRKLPVLIQINTSGENQKSGVSADEAVALAHALVPLDHLDVRGFMTMAVNSPDRSVVAGCFQRLVQTQARVRDALGGGYDELSMGMSGDFQIAVEQGSTCVRIGTAIFGQRSY